MLIHRGEELVTFLTEIRKRSDKDLSRARGKYLTLHRVLHPGVVCLILSRC